MPEYRRRHARVTLKEIRASIHGLSQRLRRERGLVYSFSPTARILAMQIMIDPEGVYQKLVRWARTSPDIPTWDAALEFSASQHIDVHEYCRQNGWKMEDLEHLYHSIRGAVLSGETA